MIPNQILRPYSAQKPIFRLAAALSLLLFTTAECGAFQQRISLVDLVSIELKPESIVNQESVRLVDVATIKSGNMGLMQVVEQVEVCELDDLNSARRVTQLNVRARLVLAGLTLDQIRFSGPNETQVKFGEPDYVTDEAIATEANQVLCQEMGLESRDVRVQLQNALMQTMPPAIQNMNGLKVKVIPPNKVTLGTVTMGVQFWNKNQLLVTRYAVFNVRKRHRVAIARASLSKEYPLDVGAVEFDERYLAEPTDELSMDQIRGRNVKAVVPAGAILQMKDLQASRTGKAITIKKGELVKVTAFNGRLRLQMSNVEAVTEGGIGETIELKNRSSARTFSGEVTSPGHVTVRL